MRHAVEAALGGDFGYGLIGRGEQLLCVGYPNKIKILFKGSSRNGLKASGEIIKAQRHVLGAVLRRNILGKIPLNIDHRIVNSALKLLAFDTSMFSSLVSLSIIEVICAAK